MDREKVKKGLECCCEQIEGMNCDHCPYDKEQIEIGEINQCTSALAYDALALLKEQQEYIEYWSGKYDEYGKAYMKVRDERDALMKEQEAKTQGGDSGMCEICSFYERALPMKPNYNARTNWYECGACHYSMTSGMHCKGELIPAYKVGFCAKCGKGVMWE